MYIYCKQCFISERKWIGQQIMLMLKSSPLLVGLVYDMYHSLTVLVLFLQRYSILTLS